MIFQKKNLLKPFKNKFTVNFSIIIFNLAFIISCSTDSNIFDGSKFYLSKQDKTFLNDSFQVVQVIDNRIIKDSIIGESDYNKNPLIIDRPLKDYVKMSLNSLICKDTTQSEKIPITVYIDDFYSGRNYTFFSQCAYNKYSYLFEYPYNNKTNKLRITDSAEICGDPEISKQ